MAGFVKKRGKVWYAVLPYTDPTGARKKLWKSCPEATNEKEAKLRLAQLVVAQASGQDINPQRFTFADLATKYLAFKKLRLAPDTYSHYESCLNSRFVPLMGKWVLRDIKPVKLQEIIDTQTDLSPNARHLYWVILRNCFRHAYKIGLLEVDPSDRVEAPKRSRNRTPYVSPEQVAAIFEAADEQPVPMGFLVRMAVLTGAREGELLRLRWDGISEGGMLIEKSKTEAGERTVTLGTDTLALLKKVRVMQAEHKLAAPSRGLKAWKDTGLVFTLPTGMGISQRYVQTLWTYIDKATGFGLRFHDLRHTHVSLLIDQGVDLKVIQERVGHASIKTTADTYGHLRPRSDAAAVENLESALRVANGKQIP